MNSSVILSTAYLGPIQYYSKLKNYSECVVELFEHLPKQTYRSRCEIYSPNGILTLSVPLVKRNHRQVMKDVKIANDYDWQKLHWRSLESSYRRSPYFEYFEDDLYPLYHDKKFDFLIDLNTEMQACILKLMKLNPTITYTKEYFKIIQDADDLREIISPKKDHEEDTQFKPPVYMQVFETKHNFIPNLSIVDLLFNEGARSVNFL